MVLRRSLLRCASDRWAWPERRELATLVNADACVVDESGKVSKSEWPPMSSSASFSGAMSFSGATAGGFAVAVADQPDDEDDADDAKSRSAAARDHQHDDEDLGQTPAAKFIQKFGKGGKKDHHKDKSEWGAAIAQR